jgi:hypothetical protein
MSSLDEISTNQMKKEGGDATPQAFLHQHASRQIFKDDVNGFSSASKFDL